MTAMSFDIKSSKDLLNKLIEDYKDFKVNKLSSRIAINCAITSWHLVEWVFNEYYKSSKIYHKPSDLIRKVKLDCPSLQIMQDITNGSKHFEISKYPPKVKYTNLHKGAFNSSFSREFDISCLVGEYDDGTKFYFEDEIKKVIDFWIKFFQDELNEKIDNF